MSLVLDRVEAKTLPPFTPKSEETVIINSMAITMKELLQVCLYALTNTDLTDSKDVKKSFVDIVKEMTIVDSYNMSKKRIVVKGDENKPYLGYSFEVAFKLEEKKN